MKDDSKKMSKVHMALEFAGIILPIEKDEDGREVVPLKPVADLFGLKWEEQRIKVSSPTPDSRGAGLAKRLGSIVMSIPFGGQRREMVCIRLDRVAAYMNTINPEKVRAAGNEDGAAFLELKQEEWDDLIHAYEMAGGMFASREARESKENRANLKAFLDVMREKRLTADENDRKALGKIAEGMACDMGIVYQLELGRS